MDQAIAIEEASSTAAAVHIDNHSHTGEHAYSEGDAVVSRLNQSTWGLATGTFAVSVAIGGVVGLAAAGAMGRIATLSPGASTALVGGIGYMSVVLVPFLKYPATPPAVGDGDTIGQRTLLYFAYLLVSLIAAAVCTGLAVKLLDLLGVERAVFIGVATYLLIVLLVGVLMPTVNEIGAFPGDVLWSFRRASIATLTAMWATICATLVVLVRRLHAQQTAVRARRELAASL